MGYDLISIFLQDIQPGRLAESLIFLAVCWWKIRPHLLKIEKRMDGIERNLSTINTTMLSGFAAGDARFERIEGRVSRVEERLGPNE